MMAQYPDLYIMTFLTYILNFMLLLQSAQFLLNFLLCRPTISIIFHHVSLYGSSSIIMMKASGEDSIYIAWGQTAQYLIFIMLMASMIFTSQCVKIPYMVIIVLYCFNYIFFG